ncbi:DEKNAAC102624 [Brettanomyces naardenensis]|uniref:DEKNAAC102624 n=1 Tax=Brettanomyces naardenensis TaxID=13370 RepID=A0A448YKM5_BRENA|nr:DEKNAAC102624 [Brettanomyces naardenensis]
MSSAVPYEPDDFDNNPFAEQSVIAANSDAQSKDIRRPDDQPTLPAEPSTRTQSSQQLPSAQENSISKEDAELKKPFHDFPNEQDIKRYLPERLNKGAFSMSIKIREVEKNGNVTYKNPVFRIDALIKNIPGFRKKTYKDVRRTYKELQNLCKYLIFNNIEVFVPSLPVVTTAYNAISPEFIDCVTTSTQEWFNRVCGNPILIRNQEFVLFFEQNDFSYTPSKTRPSTNSVMATGLRRKTLKQLQPPYDASQKLAEYRPMIKTLHLECDKLVERLEKLLKVQKQSSGLDTEFYSKITDLAAMEEDREMTKIWDKFDKIMQIFTEMSLVGQVGFNSGIADSLQLISDDCYNIKESLTNRHLLMRELLSAEEGTRKRHSTIAKLKSKSIIDPVRIDDAIRSLEMASNYEKELRYEVKRTTYEMLIEAGEYTEYLTSLLKKTFKLVAKQQILQERKKLHLLTTNKLINPRESLGRLGRESNPEAANVSPSDSPRRGDSWNSRPKKSFDNDDIPKSIGSGNDIDEEISNVDAKSAASLLAGSSF